MHWERLPQELVEGILDHLHNNKPALKSCSLVCKAWLYPSYSRLFYDTRLTWDRLRVAFDPRSESTAAPLIRHLRIAHGSWHQWNKTFPSLDGFHSVTWLSLETLFWSNILPEIQMTISNRFTTITRLELERVVTIAFSELAQIICSFRCLENLILGSIYWHRSEKPSSLLRLPQRLHTLELGDDNLTEILEWLCSFGPDLTLRNVCLMSPSQHHSQDINTLLRILGPTLESFRIRLRGINCPIHLHHNTHLRFLQLDVRRGLEHETGLALILSKLVSVRIEKILPSLFHTPSRDDGLFHDCVPDEWGEVDAILARPQFSNLKSVSVRHTEENIHGPNLDNPFEWFFDRLPFCHRRGILEANMEGPFV